MSWPKALIAKKAANSSKIYDWWLPLLTKHPLFGCGCSTLHPNIPEG